MPADRGLADDHGDEIVQRYTSLRGTLIAALATRLRTLLSGRQTPESPRTIAQRLAERLRGDLPDLADTAVRAAATAGRDEAERELRQLRRDAPPSRLQVAGRVLDLARTLESTHPRIVSWAEATYRTVAFEVSQAEGGTRLMMAQRAWSRIVGHGITGYVDASGRRWELASYVEMATRSRLADAAVGAHLDRLADAGLDLVIVSNAPAECKICRDWESAILTRTGGGAREVRVEHATQDRIVTVQVAGSVKEAVGAGLLHPN